MALLFISVRKYVDSAKIAKAEDISPIKCIGGVVSEEQISCFLG